MSAVRSEFPVMAEGWLKNHFQRIYPLAVEQDTHRGPQGHRLRLICASTRYLHCFSLQFLISALLFLTSSVVFCNILHWHWQKQQSLEGKYAKLLSDFLSVQLKLIVGEEPANITVYVLCLRLSSILNTGKARRVILTLLKCIFAITLLNKNIQSYWYLSVFSFKIIFI